VLIGAVVDASPLKLSHQRQSGPPADASLSTARRRPTHAPDQWTRGRPGGLDYLPTADRTGHNPSATRPFSGRRLRPTPAPHYAQPLGAPTIGFVVPPPPQQLVLW
jgi:hypothetical protein